MLRKVGFEKKKPHPDSQLMRILLYLIRYRITSIIVDCRKLTNKTINKCTQCPRCCDAPFCVRTVLLTLRMWVTEGKLSLDPHGKIYVWYRPQNWRAHTAEERGVGVGDVTVQLFTAAFHLGYRASRPG